MANTRQIAIYGKGGIGKSTTSANLSAALSQMGEQVLQVGCDPKSDSCTTLLGGRLIPTILDTMRSEGVTETSVSSCVHRGFNGILCAEAGGPRPGAGCAGKGVALALDMLSRFKLLEKYGVTFALYDVLGDVVCGGFAQPMRRGYAQEIYLVTSGELMALYAANNLAKAINLMMEEGANVSVGGIINNQRNVPGEAELMLEFSEMLGVPIVAHIPRSQLIQAAELRRRTVVEQFPDSDQAQVYRDLAQRIRGNPIRVLPRSMELADIVELLNKHQIDLRSPMEAAGSASLGCSACP